MNDAALPEGATLWLATLDDPDLTRAYRAEVVVPAGAHLPRDRARIAITVAAHRADERGFPVVKHQPLDASPTDVLNAVGGSTDRRMVTALMGFAEACPIGGDSTNPAGDLGRIDAGAAA